MPPKRWEEKKKTDFELGILCVTRGVADLQERDLGFSVFVNACLRRYMSCDWGDTCPADSRANDDALLGGERILAEYQQPQHPDWRIWIITEWDRSVTMILFPNEY